MPALTAIKNTLTKTKTLWTLFWLTIAMTIMFGVVMRIWGLGIIDEMFHGEEILAHIAAMSPTQRLVHAWMTATLDVAYPFAYGGLFIGIALKNFDKLGPWLALPSLAVIPVDLTEGFVQVLLLNGHDGVVWLKEIVTPLKLVLYISGLVISLVGLGRGILRRGS